MGTGLVTQAHGLELTAASSPMARIGPQSEMSPGGTATQASFAQTLGVLAGFERTSSGGHTGLVTAPGRTTLTPAPKVISAKTTAVANGPALVKPQISHEEVGPTPEGAQHALAAKLQPAQTETPTTPRLALPFSASIPALAAAPPAAAQAPPASTPPVSFASILAMPAPAKPGDKENTVGKATKPASEVAASAPEAAIPATPAPGSATPDAASAIPLPVTIALPAATSPDASAAQAAVRRVAGGRSAVKVEDRGAHAASAGPARSVDEGTEESAPIVTAAGVGFAVHPEVRAATAGENAPPVQPAVIAAGAGLPGLLHGNASGNASLPATNANLNVSSSLSDGSPGSPSSHIAAAGDNYSTLVSTPNVLEVGVASSTHGWLRVRAEMSDTGAVSASLTTTSAGAFEALHKELPGISAYLASEQVGVSSLVLDRTQPVVTTTGSGAFPGDPAHGSAGHERGGSPQQGSPAASHMASDADSGLAGMGISFAGADLPAATYAGGSGGWLSVRA